MSAKREAGAQRSDDSRACELRPRAEAAWARGRYRESAQLFKDAAAQGDTRAAAELVGALHVLFPGDHRPARWAVSHAALDDPVAVALLLDALRDIGADDQVLALLGRSPAAYVLLDDPEAVGALLAALQVVNAHEQIAEVLGRDPARQVALRYPLDLVDLLEIMLEEGAHEQVAVLSRRMAQHAALLPLGNPREVAWVLDNLSVAGLTDSIAALLARDPAGRTGVEDPAAVVALLQALDKVDRLGQADGREQLEALALRAVAAVPIQNARAVGWLLDNLNRIRCRVHSVRRAIGRLRARDPAARAALDDAGEVAHLLNTLDLLRSTWGRDQIGVLLGRSPAQQVSLADPQSALKLCDTLQAVGAQQQANILLDRLGDVPLLEELSEFERQSVLGEEPVAMPTVTWQWDDLRR